MQFCYLLYQLTAHAFLILKSISVKRNKIYLYNIITSNFNTKWYKYHCANVTKTDLLFYEDDFFLGQNHYRPQGQTNAAIKMKNFMERTLHFYLRLKGDFNYHAKRDESLKF